MISTVASKGAYVAGEWSVAMRGAYTPPAGTKRCMIVHGGHGQSAFGGVAQAPGIETIMAETGIVSMHADYVDGKQWGNDTVQSRISSLWTYAQSSYGAKADKLLLYGTSMGGCCVLNWAINNPTKVAAILLTIPAVDLGDIYDNNRGTSIGVDAVTEINTAYGGSAAWTSARPTHNPAVNAASLVGIPVLQFYSDTDPVCVPATQTAFSTASGSTLVDMGAYGHGTPPAGDPRGPVIGGQAVSFLAQHV